MSQTKAIQIQVVVTIVLVTFFSLDAVNVLLKKKNLNYAFFFQSVFDLYCNQFMDPSINKINKQMFSLKKMNILYEQII